MKKMIPAVSKAHYERFGVKEKEIQMWEDGMRSHGRENSFEWWYVDASFDNDIKAVLTYMTKSDEIDYYGPSKPTVKLVLTMPDERRITKVVSEPEGSTIMSSKIKCNVEISNSSLRYYKGDYILKFDEGGIKLDLVMKSIVPMIRKGAGHLLFGDDEENAFGWLAAQPTSKITGSLFIGGEEYKLKGSGYHDHNWSDVAIEDIMNHWYWGRVVFDDYTVVTSQICTHSDYGSKYLNGFALIKGNRILDPVGFTSVVKREEEFQHEFTKKFFHNTLKFENQLEDGSKYTVIYKRDKDIEEYFVNDGMEDIKRNELISKGIDPSYVRCTGDVTLIVEKNGETKKYESKGIWEQAHLGTNAKEQ